MSAHSPKPILSNEEVQRIIDERLEVGMTAAFTATMVDDVIVADKVSYSRKG